QLYSVSNAFFFQAEDGIRDRNVTGVQTCALPISRAEGAIGYVEMSHLHGLNAASIGVGDEFVDISPEAAAQVVADSPRSEQTTGEYDLALDLDYGTTEQGSYPLVLVSYQTTCLEYPDAQEAERVKAFL